MKTAISLPDKLFHLADEYAQERGMSRSELYAKALEMYLDTHRREGVTQRINRVCEKVDTSLNAYATKAAKSTLLNAEWDD